MKTYLTLRCPICPNQSFRSLNVAEAHILQRHEGRPLPRAEWVALPAGVYAGGHDLEGTQDTRREAP